MRQRLQSLLPLRLLLKFLLRLPPGTTLKKKTEVAVTYDPGIPYVRKEITLPPMTGREFVDEKNIGMLETAAKAIIETEAPICFDVLVDRLTEACGITRKTTPVRERCEYIIRRFRFPVSKLNITHNPNTGYSDPNYDRLFIWTDAGKIGCITDNYRRTDRSEPTYVPLEEAACAAVYLARSQFGMPMDSLIVETGKALGFKMSTPTVKILCKRAIEFAIGKGELTYNGRLVK